MLFLLRKLRRTLIEENKVRNYLLYACGEIILVVIGILIALQINNWNAAKQEEASVVSYLNSIARNIRDDIDEVSKINNKRIIAKENAFRGLMHSGPLNRDVLAIASNTLTAVTELLHFNSSQSGFEAFMNSGTLDQMQGRDIEKLLYDYYDTVHQIEVLEENHNEILKLYWIQAMEQWPQSIEGWELANPSALSQKRIEDIQPVIKEYLSGRSINSLLEHAIETASLLLEYDRLKQMGQAFIRTVESGRMDFDAETQALLDAMHVPESGIGYPVVIEDGLIYYANYRLQWADSLDWRIVGSAFAEETDVTQIFQLSTIKREEDSLHIAYPGGADWAAFSVTVVGLGDTRPSQDYSMFKELVLDLKGDHGGESVLVNLKDSDDPDDGTQTNIELTLTDQWQTYRIDLARFDNADLSNLHLALGFLFLKEPQSFSVRNVYYR